MTNSEFPLDDGVGLRVTSRAANGVELIQVEAWKELDWLWHGFSTVRVESSGAGSASFNLGFTLGQERARVAENRLRLVEAAAGSREVPLVTVSQVHSNRSVFVTEPVPGREADGLITDRNGLLLGILTADCVPVLVADVEKRVVGAFHAGWRGTVERVVELGVRGMVDRFGSESRDVVAAIGPRIGSCCYRVGDEVRERFEEEFDYGGELFMGSGLSRCGLDQVSGARPEAPGHKDEGGRREFFLDLVAANRRQLLAAGLGAELIYEVGGCTVCHPELFYSHRGSGGSAGRMMAVVGIR